MAKNDDFNSVNRVNQPSEKICRGKCGRLKPLSDFNNNRTKRDGKQEICRQCQSEFMKDYNARKAYENKMQLTAGDVQLDPKPAPLSSAGKLVKKDLVSKKVIPHQEKKTEVLPPGIHRDIEPIDRKFADIKREADKIIDESVKLRHSIGKPLHLTDEEKAIIMNSLDRHVAIIEKIIEKLSS